MPDILEVGALIRLDQILPGLDRMASATEAAAERMNNSFTRLQSGLVLSSGAMFDLQKAGVDTGSLVVPSVDKIPPALGRASGAGREAREAMRGIGEEMGVHLPRFVSSFLASIGPIGGIMAAAFAPIAIIGLIEFLDKIPGAIANMSDSIMGYGEAEKKAFADAVKESDEAFLHTKNLEEAQRNLKQEVKLLGDMAEETFMTRWQKATAEAEKNQSKLLLLIPGLSGIIAGVEGLASANAKLADAATAAAEKQNAASKQVHADQLATQQRLFANETEYLKLGEIGVSAYSKMRAELSGLNVEQAQALLKLKEDDEDTSENIRLNKELYDLKREGIEKTYGLELSNDTLALEQARLQGSISVAKAMVALHLQTARDILEIDSTQWGQKIAADRIGEEESYAIEKGGIASRIALLQQRQASTGKSEAPAIASENSALEALELSHQGRMRAIDTAETKFEMDGQKTLQALIVQNFAERARLQAEDIATARRGAEENVRLDEERVESVTRLATKILSEEARAANERLARHRESLAQWRADEVTSLDQWFAVQMKGLEAELEDAKRAHDEGSNEYGRVLDRMEGLKADYERRVGKIDDEVAAKSKRDLDVVSRDFDAFISRLTAGHNRLLTAASTTWLKWSTDGILSIGKVLTEFNSAVTKMALGQESFGRAMTEIWQSLASAVINQILTMVEAWIFETLLGVVKQKSADEITVQSKAGVSGAAGFASVMAALPFPANVAVAPGVAAGAVAQTEAFGHFDMGGMAAKTGLAVVHQGEITMPGDVSRGFRMMAAGGLGGRTVHNHFSVVLQHHGPDARQVLEEELVPRLQMAMRRGAI